MECERRKITYGGEEDQEKEVESKMNEGRENRTEDFNSFGET